MRISSFSKYMYSLQRGCVQSQYLTSWYATTVTRCKRLDLCWPQWIHFGSQEHYRTSWNSMESHRTSWNPTEAHGIPQKLMESHRTSRNPMEPHGIPWKVLEHGGTLTNDYK
jgi:hypothetical protein